MHINQGIKRNDPWPLECPWESTADRQAWALPLQNFLALTSSDRKDFFFGTLNFYISYLSYVTSAQTNKDKGIPTLVSLLELVKAIHTPGHNTYQLPCLPLVFWPDSHEILTSLPFVFNYLVLNSSPPTALASTRASLHFQSLLAHDSFFPRSLWKSSIDGWSDPRSIHTWELMLSAK